MKEVRGQRATQARLTYRIVLAARICRLPILHSIPSKRPRVSRHPRGECAGFPPRVHFGAYGGRAFLRAGTARGPLHQVWGPAIPAEMVRHQSRAAFDQLVDMELPPRVLHEIDAILGGVVP
jgi:hypothetical protein